MERKIIEAFLVKCGGILIGFMIVCCLLLSVNDTFNQQKIKQSIELAKEYDKGYRTGVSNALDCMMLLNLEQQLYNTNRTWGEMSTIVKSRLNAK